MILQEIITVIEEFAPPHYAEDFDNVGLLVGYPQQDIHGVLVTLDVLEEVVEEAIQKKCNCILAFHPILFKGVKSLTGKDYVERTVIKAIQNNIAIYAIHTALDNHHKGVNYQIAKVLGLKNCQILIPKAHTIEKLTTYVPVVAAPHLREALFNAGAGNIGNYSNCSFSTTGEGSFLGNDESNPAVGEKGKLHVEKEMQLHLTYDAHLRNKIIQTLCNHHPYEEVAYEVQVLANNNQQRGIGMLGYLEEAVTEEVFIQNLKEIFGTPVIRHSKKTGQPLQKIAVLGGSGAFAIKNAINCKADAYVTSDLKYHDFFQAEGKILLADVGHYESEQFTKNLLHAFLTKKFTNFALVLSEINTNPIQYS